MSSDSQQSGSTYDPDARRDTPLALKLKERIRRDGPITVAQYMDACLQDPEHGYYRTKTAIGAAGDFVTAPEISQVFGELIGLWCAVVWQQMGQPARFDLVEFGPGRGTLMADMVRAGRLVPGFVDAANVVLVESNAALRAEQAATLHRALPSITPRWVDGFDALSSDTPAIVVGNEFIDTFSVDQCEIEGTRARQRKVGLDANGRLCFLPSGSGGGSAKIVETPRYQPLAGLRHALGERPHAVLLVDYGYVWALDGEPPTGETLQAVRRHRVEHPLTSPGEADLTAHVDFTTLAGAFTCALPDGRGGALVDGPVTQANFLGALGIMQRASKLMTANPAKAHDIETGVARLMAVPGMGDRFKVLGVRSPDLPPLPGF